MPPARPVFLVSDHTGITAEIVGKSLLSQFPDVEFTYTSLPFVDSPEKAAQAAARVREVWAAGGLKPLVFSTLTDARSRHLLQSSGALVLDIYGQFAGALERELGRAATPLRGRLHGIEDHTGYHARIDALNYTLATDDGLNTDKYALADLILLGVSRSGKTPAALYLALQYGLRVANYPLTAETFAQPGLPACLRPCKARLRGLTLAPERLAQIRSERRPNSHYASLETCREELAKAIALMRAEAIPVIDTTRRSVEEIAALLNLSRDTARVTGPNQTA
ncbi:MAG: pyruvate, water dikinase regulatory protein [Thiobacillaceae bacterium]